MIPRTLGFEHGISAIDADFKRPGLAAIHLIVEGGKAAIVDIGTSYSVPGVVQVLRQKNIPAQNVEYLFLTHVHLDHAGGAGELMSHLPNARIVVHPRGSRHVADPRKLIAGAISVYGEDEITKTYGKILPVEPTRIIEAPDGFTISLNGRSFLFLDTPGHARHHNCIFDENSQSIFTGDTFGISYREFDVDGREFVFPTTSPVQFDPVAAHASIDRIMGYKPRYAFLTHYSRIAHPERNARALHEMLDEHVSIAESARGAGANRHEILVTGVRDLLLKRVIAHGCRLPEPQILGLLGMDVELNAQGLEAWLDSRY